MKRSNDCCSRRSSTSFETLGLDPERVFALLSDSLRTFRGPLKLNIHYAYKYVFVFIDIHLFSLVAIKKNLQQLKGSHFLRSIWSGFYLCKDHSLQTMHCRQAVVVHPVHVPKTIWERSEFSWSEMGTLH